MARTEQAAGAGEQRMSRRWLAATGLLAAIWCIWAVEFGLMHLWMGAADGLGLAALSLAAVATVAVAADFACRR